MERVFCHQFRMDVDAYHTDLWPAAADAQACIDACAAQPICEAVVFRDYGAADIGSCMGFSSRVCDMDAPDTGDDDIFFWGNMQVWEEAQAEPKTTPTSEPIVGLHNA